MLDRLKSAALRSAAAFATAAALAGAAQAQTDYAAIEADPALWAISDEDNTVYLFGTVHILPPELDWKTDEIRAAIDSADIVYFEADATSEAAQAEAQALIPQLGLNAPGVTLSSLISEEAKEDMAIIAGRLGAPAEALAAQMDPMQPWLASLTLAVLQIQAGGYDPQSGVEYAIADYVGEDAEYGYFETLEQQLRFFADMPMEIQIADFEVGVAQMVEDPDMLSELVQAWAVGDMDTVDRLMNEGMRDSSEELFQTLIVQRNEDWIPQIEAVLAGDQDAFIAVGAGHMPGDHGVIALLEAAGHTVERR
ncbi:MAG: TraB/GumN family protein [Oceanicaulis sp.]